MKLKDILSHYFKPQHTVILLLFIGPALSLAADAIPSPQEAAADAEWFWNLVIAIFVIAVSIASAALPVAATKQWLGSWRLAAGAPLLVLLLWIVVIVVARIDNPNAHRFWPFEIFAWAMLNMIYMVGIMTAKRILDKADKESSSTN